MNDPLLVDVWWADLRQADLSLADALPAAERARVREPAHAADRGRRLVAAALLQRAVGRAGAAPVEVDRTCEECGRQHGRPVVAGGPHVSVAHAGVLVVVATCAGAPVGVDVERTGRFGGDEARTAAWALHEAGVKAGVEAGVTPGRAGTAQPLRPPLPGYAAALHVRSGARPSVTEHHVTGLAGPGGGHGADPG